jgi:hypothetical protein
MKKKKTNNRPLYTLLLAVLLCIPASSGAQSRGGARPAFQKGDNTIGFALGVGSIYSYRSGSEHLPAFAINYDHGLINNVGPGTIGIGGVMAFQRSSYRSGNGFRSTWTNFIIGFRGTYHLTILKDVNNRFDPYAGLTLGIRTESFDDNSNGALGGDYGDADAIIAPFIGAKYNFTPKFGAFSELGFDYSFFRIGLHVNF